MIVDGPSFPQCWCMLWYCGCFQSEQSSVKTLVWLTGSPHSYPKNIQSTTSKNTPKMWSTLQRETQVHNQHPWWQIDGPSLPGFIWHLCILKVNSGLCNLWKWTLDKLVKTLNMSNISKWWSVWIQNKGVRQSNHCGKTTSLKTHFSDVCLTKSHSAWVSSQGGQTNHHSCLAPPGRLDRA